MITNNCIVNNFIVFVYRSILTRVGLFGGFILSLYRQIGWHICTTSAFIALSLCLDDVSDGNLSK